MLKNKIQLDLVTALKSKNTEVLSVLRLLMSAVKNKEIEIQKELSDDEIIAIIQKQVKELAEAKELFQKGNRNDLVVQNEKQIAILQCYLPQELSADELELKIKQIIDQNKDIYQKNPKAIIGICMRELKSKSSSDKIIAALNKIQWV